MNILKYIKHTQHFGIIFKRQTTDFNSTDNFLLQCFSDASFANEPGCKSRYGYFYFVAGCLVVVVSPRLKSPPVLNGGGVSRSGSVDTFIREFLEILEFFKHPFPFWFTKTTKVPSHSHWGGLSTKDPDILV